MAAAATSVLDNAVIAAVVGGLVSALVAVFMEYKKMRRGELLAAYSKWEAEILRTISRGRYYFDLAKRLVAGKESAHSDFELNCLREDQDTFMELNDECNELETRLAIATNEVILVEWNGLFRKRVEQIYHLAIRNLTSTAFGDVAVAATGYRSRVDPLTTKELSDFLGDLIETHGFRGLNPETDVPDGV